jgi:hypothetical protein
LPAGAGDHAVSPVDSDQNSRTAAPASPGGREGRRVPADAAAVDSRRAAALDPRTSDPIGAGGRESNADPHSEFSSAGRNAGSVDPARSSLASSAAAEPGLPPAALKAAKGAVAAARAASAHERAQVDVERPAPPPRAEAPSIQPRRRTQIRADRGRPAPVPPARRNLPVELTVEIGAIEIVTDTTVRRPGRATAPLSLSDYLRRKGGR